MLHRWYSPLDPQYMCQISAKIEARTHELWRFLQNVRNDEEEKMKKTRNFYEIDSYLGNGLRDLAKI